MKINDVILEKAAQIGEAPVSAKVQGATGAKIAQTSGGQFMNKADRTNQAKVDAALGPGFKAGSKEANLALAKKFGQPAAAPAPAAASNPNSGSSYTGNIGNATNDPVETPAAASNPNSGSSYTGNIGNATNDPVETPAAGAEGNGATPGAHRH